MRKLLRYNKLQRTHESDFQAQNKVKTLQIKDQTMIQEKLFNFTYKKGGY